MTLKRFTLNLKNMKKERIHILSIDKLNKSLRNTRIIKKVKAKYHHEKIAKIN